MEHIPQKNVSGETTSATLRVERDVTYASEGAGFSSSKNTDSCNHVPVLNRQEDSQNVFYTTYSVGLGGENVFIVRQSKPSVAAFHVLPLKDSGGTIRFFAGLIELVSYIQGLHFRLVCSSN